MNDFSRMPLPLAPTCAFAIPCTSWNFQFSNNRHCILRFSHLSSPSIRSRTVSILAWYSLPFHFLCHWLCAPISIDSLRTFHVWYVAKLLRFVLHLVFASIYTISSNRRLLSLSCLYQFDPRSLCLVFFIIFSLLQSYFLYCYLLTFHVYFQVTNEWIPKLSFIGNLIRVLLVHLDVVSQHVDQQSSLLSRCWGEPLLRGSAAEGWVFPDSVIDRQVTG